MNVNVNILLTFATPVDIHYNFSRKLPEISWLDLGSAYCVSLRLLGMIARVQSVAESTGRIDSAFNVIWSL